MSAGGPSTIGQLQAALAAGDLTAVELVQQCLARIAADEPALHSIIALDPSAEQQARDSDTRRTAGAVGALAGIPVLIKDNIATTGLPTTAGSRALADSRPSDAALVTRLRAAGAIILGKTNLSEWANFRSDHSTSGWSAVGGQTRNPHVLDRNTSGSSSGSAAAVAAGFAPVAIGTETDGSILSPAGTCGIVGFKPTLGTVPGDGIVPISSAQDTAGPMSRSVADAAVVFEVLSGVAVGELRTDALAGARVGVWTPDGADEPTLAVLAEAVAAVRAAGATVTPVELPLAEIDEVEYPALLAEFREEISAYLAGAAGAAVRSLADLIAYNESDPDELVHFGQQLLVAALEAPPTTDDGYREQRATATRLARALLDAELAQRGLDVILTLSNGPAWRIDYERGDAYDVLSTAPAAVAGYPSISVPAGFVGALPIGVNFVSAAHTDAQLLSYAYAFEQLTQAARAPGYLPTID